MGMSLVATILTGGGLMAGLASRTQPEPGAAAHAALRQAADRWAAVRRVDSAGHLTQAIVLNSSGDQRRWAVSLMTRSTDVPIVVAPGDNVVIEFKEGWKVERDDEARIVSNLVPFANSALYNKVGEQPEYVLSAWGITAGGPVQFVYRDVEKK
jgi:hypothetical protein